MAEEEGCPMLRINGKHKLSLITETTFGHGDSSTHIYGQCEFCKAKDKGFHIHGFPATYTDMRKAQALFLQACKDNTLTI